MNWDHIRAVMSGGSIYRGMSGDRHIVSSGFIAIAAPSGFMDDQGKELPSLISLWELNRDVPVCPLTVGQCGGEGRTITRAVGPYFIAERFVRCCGEGVTWTLGNAPNGVPPMVVHRDGEMLALVMPMKMGEVPSTIPEPTDEQVFTPFACPENGRYLQSVKSLYAELGKAESDRRIARERAAEAEAEAEDLSEEISSLREALKSRQATTAQPV